MREAVEDGTSLRNAADSLAIVLLIEEESGFLTIDVVHGVFYAVFSYFGHAGKVGAKPRASPEALVFLHALKLAYLNVVALVYCGDMLAHIREGLHKQLVERVLYALRAEGQHLRNKDVTESVDGESGEAVSLAEYETAAAEILRAHDGAAVVQRVAYPAGVEVPVEFVVGVAGDDAYAYLGVVVYVTCAEVAPLAAENVGKAAVFVFAGDLCDLVGIDPRVSAAECLLALFGDGRLGIVSFHII